MQLTLGAVSHERWTQKNTQRFPWVLNAESLVFGFGLFETNHTCTLGPLTALA
jgi:hypothetical protein